MDAIYDIYTALLSWPPFWAIGIAGSLIGVKISDGFWWPRMYALLTTYAIYRMVEVM